MEKKTIFILLVLPLMISLGCIKTKDARQMTSSITPTTTQITTSTTQATETTETTETTTILTETTAIPTTTTQPNLSACDDAEDNATRELCYMQAARDSMDSSICLLLQPANTEDCLMSIAKSTGNPRPCPSIKDEAKRDSCYYAAAIYGMNSSICGNVKSSSLRNQCLAFTEKNPRYCGMIDDESTRDWCYLRMVLKSADMNTCYNITNLIMRDDCIHQYLVNRKFDANECFRITNTTIRDACFYDHISYGKMNPQLCWLIEEPSLKENCSQTFEPLIKKGTCS